MVNRRTWPSAILRIALLAAANANHAVAQDIFVADFIGDANLVKAEIVRVDGAAAHVRIDKTDIELPHRGLAPGEVTVAIRPEAIRLTQGHKEAGIAGDVVKATYLGSLIEYTVATPLGELFVTDPRFDRAFTPGSAVTVGLAKHGVTLVEA